MPDYLFFIPTGGGGAEKVSINIATFLFNINKDIHVVFIKGNNNNVCKFLHDEIPRSFVSSKFKVIRYIKIFEIIRKYKPKCVFASLTALSCILIISKLFFNIKVITRQCFTPASGKWIVNKTIELLFGFADMNIAQTVEMREQMLKQYGLSPNKVVAINNLLNTVDIERKIANANPIVSEFSRYIAIGRISPQKDYTTLIRAFKLVIGANPKSRLIIIGTPDNNEIFQNLIKLIDELNLAQTVIFKTYTDNPYIELINSDCFVLSSITEGLPNVLLEAMYLNVPCVATQCIPFISEAIVNGVNGYTAPVKDIEALATAMINAVNLKGRIQNINRNIEIQKQLIAVFSI